MITRQMENLIVLLYMHIFLPEASGIRSNQLIVPWAKTLRDTTFELQLKFIKNIEVETKLDREGIHDISTDLAFIISKPNKLYSLHASRWLYLAQTLEIGDIHKSYLEQVLVAWGKDYHSPLKSVTLGQFDPTSGTLQSGQTVSVNTAVTPPGLAPFWKWYDAFIVPSVVGLYGADLLSKLDDLFHRLFIPCVPRDIALDPKQILYLPLPNISHILTKSERIFPKEAKDIGQLRPWASINFFTSGFRVIAPYYTNPAEGIGSVGDPIADRYLELDTAITNEAERLAKCNDKDFSNAHVSGSVEDITSYQSLAEEQVTSLLKRHGVDADPSASPGAPDVSDTVDLGLPEDNHQGYLSNEAEDSSGALDTALQGLGDNGSDGEPSEGNPPEGEETDTDPNSVDPTDANATDDNDAQANTSTPTNTVSEGNPQFRKVWGKSPIKLDDQLNLEAHLYRSAVDRMNDVIQKDPGDAIDPKVKADLNYWCSLWLWHSSTQTTAKLLKALKLEKYLKD